MYTFVIKPKPQQTPNCQIQPKIWQPIDRRKKDIAKSKKNKKYNICYNDYNSIFEKKAT